MMKKILTLVFAVLISAAVYSQGSIYSMTYTMSMGVAETGKYVQNTSFRGFTFEGRSFVSDNVTIGGLWNWTTFYEKLGGESFTQGTSTLTGNQYRYMNAFPFLVQAHYYLAEDPYSPRVYLGGGLGAYKIMQRTEVGVWSVEENNWHFGVSPEVGILYPISMDTQFMISLRYHYAFKAKNTVDHSWFGLSVGFAWGD